MAQKLNPTPALPFQDMGYLVQSLIRELTAANIRSNLLLAGDGTEAATGPVILKSYTVSTLPTASAYTGGIIYVSNGTSNKRLAVSDGTNWRFPDGNVVS